MAVIASRIFDFLDAHPSPSLERDVVRQWQFNHLRNSLYSIILNLKDADEADAIQFARSLRILVSEWLTVPQLFDESLPTALEEFGEIGLLTTRWGRDIGSAIQAARVTATNMVGLENPVRTVLRSAIDHYRSSGMTFKIYCHRLACPHFDSVFTGTESATLDSDCFLHSPSDYRQTATFDVLIKIGPLRSMGWGAIPDAIITAPRFHTLRQIVWSGCNDENGFGLDPASNSFGDADGQAQLRARAINWQQKTTDVGDDVHNANVADSIKDEFLLFDSVGHRADVRRAALVQLDRTRGILFARHSMVPSFSPDEDDSSAVSFRSVDEALVPGMFIALPDLGEIDVGELRAHRGHYSRIWHQHLVDAIKSDYLGLVRRLAAEGLNLVDLHGRLLDWCRPPTSVIHAPKKARHFEILIKVLGIGSEKRPDSRRPPLPWWQYAWHEIALSRGEAIQTGMHVHEIGETELLASLAGLSANIRAQSRTHNIFLITLPPDGSLVGTVEFLKILSIDNGYSAPDAELRRIYNLNEFEQWRD